MAGNLAVIGKVILIIPFFYCLTGYCQNGTISGKVSDTSAKKDLGLATVTVFKARDTSIVTYRLSNPNGEFKVSNLPLEVPLRMMVTYSGYEAYRKEFILTAKNNQLHFDSVFLIPTTRQLDEVMVFAERPPVMIRKDTIEFNASAFKTLPNALVEDLLKKLPGVQVDKDGNIAVNGKVVNRILVDGKTFFGDDPKMATRNLPANVIDKVQVMDDKEELMRNGDDNLNNVGKVINLTLKKGVKKGWFGKMYAGAGTDNLYEAGAIANIYRDTLQVSVLGYANNLNKPGFSFSELMQTAGLDRSASNMQNRNMTIWNNPGGSGISINGVNFGGSQNYGGISTSKGAGFNINHAPNAKRSFFIQYFYGRLNIDRLNINDVDQYNSDTIINTNTRLTGDVVTNTHNIGVGARLKPDSVTNILVNANYQIGNSEDFRNSTIFSNNNKLGQLSHGAITQQNGSQLHYYKHSISITHLSRTKAGRRYSINQNLDINNRFNDNTSESNIHYIYPTTFDSVYAQLRNENIPRTDAVTTFTFSEPLNKKFTVRMAGRYEFSKLHNDINTFNRSNSSQKFDQPNNLLTNQFVREANRINFRSGVEFKKKDLTITPSLRLLMQYVNNDFASLQFPIKQKQTDLLPDLNIVYKQLNFNYNRDVTLPAYTYLLPVTDNTNPYFIAKGNTNLLPAKKDNIQLNYFFNNQRKNLVMSIYMNGGFTNNDIVQSINIDNRGVQTMMPVNVNGSSNFYINYNISKQYKNNPKFIFSFNHGVNINYNHNRLLFNNESSWQSTTNFGSWLGVNLNWNDKLEFNTTYSPGYNFTSYTNPVFKKLSVFSHYWENEVIVRMPKHVIWETQLSYSYNGSIAAPNPKSVVRWNGAVNFTFLKNEAGVLKLSVFDILNTNNNINVFASRNMVTTSYGNILTRYFMATFTYNVRPAGVKKKIGGRDRLFMF